MLTLRSSFEVSLSCNPFFSSATIRTLFLAPILLSSFKSSIESAIACISSRYFSSHCFSFRPKSSARHFSSCHFRWYSAVWPTSPFFCFFICSTISCSRWRASSLSVAALWSCFLRSSVRTLDSCNSSWSKAIFAWNLLVSLSQILFSSSAFDFTSNISAETLVKRVVTVSRSRDNLPALAAIVSLSASFSATKRRSAASSLLSCITSESFSSLSLFIRASSFAFRVIAAISDAWGENGGDLGGSELLLIRCREVCKRPDSILVKLLFGCWRFSFKS
mmetsp:Transcript_3731/g.5775  ORF Transcript_3731/g.5775 Transcript_3731/m.5775 type:complete len:277 (+) Transcript_3731:1149-1979(+)